MYLKNEKEKLICIKTGKVCFSKKDAGDTIRRLSERRRNRTGRKKIVPKRSYYCKFCGTYHLTHNKFFLPNKHKKDFTKFKNNV